MTDLLLTVAIPTYRRPSLLADTLPLVLAQVRALTADHAVPVIADVLVVDNDAEGSAGEAVSLHRGDDLRYVVEATPGIVAARNRALDENADRHVLVFIDDDERPRAAWLSSLVHTYLESRPAAVMGRVVSQYDVDRVDPWVAAGKLFERRYASTGTELGIAAAGNLLVDLVQLRALGVRFDPRLGLSGGEDSLMSRLLVRRGGRIVLCTESVADDYVVAERLTRRWLLRRGVSQGNVRVRVELLLAESAADRWRARLAGVARGLARLVGGAARATVGVLTRSLGHRAVGLRTMARGIGMLRAAAGGRVEEYSRD